MSRRHPVTVREKIAASYARVAAADSALSAGRSQYNRLDEWIAARLYKGLVQQTMAMRSLCDDERLKMTMPQACYYCGSTERLSIDHLIPKDRGGPDDADNLVWACRRCNSSKSNRDLVAWMQSRGAFPPILLLRRYLKLVARHCENAGCMDAALEELDGTQLPFDVRELPTEFPPLNELVLWINAGAPTGAHLPESARPNSASGR